MKVFEHTDLQRNQECSAHGVVFPMGKINKAENWKRLTDWCAVLSLGLGHIKLLQPRPQVG